MAGTLRVLKEEEIGCIAGGSMEGAGDVNYMPPQSSWLFDGVPIVAGSSFGLGMTTDFGGYAAYQAAQEAAAQQAANDAWAAAGTGSGFYDVSNVIHVAPDYAGIPQDAIVVTASTLQGLMPSAYVFQSIAYSAYNAGMGLEWTDIPLWWLPDSDIEDFKEFLLEHTDTTLSELDQSFVSTSMIGADKYALIWDNNNFGSIYKIQDNFFTDDTYTYMGNIQITGISGSNTASAGVSNTGGSLNLSSGGSVTYIMAGSGG